MMFGHNVILKLLITCLENLLSFLLFSLERMSLICGYDEASYQTTSSFEYIDYSLYLPHQRIDLILSTHRNLERLEFKGNL